MNHETIAAPMFASHPPAPIRAGARIASILDEQLLYLMNHGPCVAGCPECARLQRVAEILTEPFRTEQYTSPRVS